MKEDTISKNFQYFFLHPSILFYILVESSAYNRNVHASNTLYWSDLEDSVQPMHMQICFCIQNFLSILRWWCLD